MKAIDAVRLRARALTRHHIRCTAAIGGFLIVASYVVGGAVPASVDKQSSDAGGAERYLTHVSTDKPIYRIGETIYVRGVMLRASGHLPMAEAAGPAAYIEIKGPKGNTVTSSYARIVDSTAAFSWDIPASEPGGQYTARISHPGTGDAPAERKFDIRAYRAPRLNSQIVFLRDGYGPGDTVTANLHVDRAEGGIPAGARVSIVARVDGAETWQGETRVDDAGNASARFKLPADIARGEGALAMTIDDGGSVETAAKTIPILQQTLDVGIYPEGGDLVAGLPNRVYLEAKTPARKPADMAGIVVNAEGKEVATFRTEHEGRGRFTFTPAAGEAYSLKVTEPAGIRTVFPLSAVQESGVVLASTSDVIARQKDVVVRVAATAAGVYGVGLSQRGKGIAFTSFRLKANQPADITLNVPKSADGAVVATIYDDHKNPKAERLLFRQPDRRLNVKVVADRTDYIPGDKVTLRIATTDDRGKPVGAVVGLSVTDSSVLEMIEKREQAPRLPVMVLLEDDVLDLADAHIYLDETNPRAALATDLLLGTQGWRRFATVDPVKWIAENGNTARRAPTDKPQIFAAQTRTAAQLLAATRDGLSVTDGFHSPVDAEAGRGNGQVLITMLPGYRANPLGHEFDTIGGLPMTMINTVRDGLSVTDGFNPGGVGSNTILNPDMISEIRLILNCSGSGKENRTIAKGDSVISGGFGNGPYDGRHGSCGASPWGIGLANYPFGASLGIREYAHQRGPDWTEDARSDFAETVYWNAGVKTDSSKGLATVSFNLSDSVTSFRVLADGFTRDGALGASASTLESQRPFFIEPKLPLQVTSGDVIQLPIGLVNGMSRELGGAAITPHVGAGLMFTLTGGDGSTLLSKERSRRVVQIDVDRHFTGSADLTVDAKAGPYRDSVTRKLDVQPLGFPNASSTGGMLASNGSSSFEFTLPAETVRGSIATSVVVYPTPLSSMTAALQALIHEPHGCFEQTSSTSYPMVMAQQYFLTHTGIEPALIENTRNLLEVSYKKLLGFESRGGGYEWFGGNPGHEALTAYGLLQFRDMSGVRDMDSAMLLRTRDWLLGRRDDQGGFNRDRRGHGDGIGSAPADTTNAYITWALVESGEKGLEPQIAAVKASANSTADSYIVALAANILQAAGDRDGARHMMDKLARAQAPAGNVQGAVTGITRSGGEAIAIETTALAVLAWLRDPSYAYNVESGLKWIGEANKNGRFGSTQSTILALRAIVAFDAAHAHPKAAGRILLTVDGRTIGTPLAFTANAHGALVLPEFASELGTGKHIVALRMEDGSPMPYSISVKYHSTLPDSSEQSQIGVRVTLKDEQIREGGITEATVAITNKSDEAIPTPVAIVGIPGGLEVRHDQLKELVKAGKIDAYEVIGREVVLYWRYLKANDTFDLPLSLIAAIPGSYTGPASRAYLFYTDEYKDWAPGLKVNITPRE